MKFLPFKVSAKTARLFGRENVSNAEAAISELVKNTYDADATICVVCFLPKYRSTPSILPIEDFQYLQDKYRQLEQFYQVDASGCASLRAVNINSQKSAYSIVNQLVEIWIIDNGSGMTGKTIENCWMVIGTNDKEKNVISQKGRARTGAKGIGRFAMDRLGSRCTVYSSAKVGDQLRSIRWDVDWREFDKEGRVLDQISAQLEEDVEPLNKVLNILRSYPELTTGIEQTTNGSADWNTGTAIKIGLLRDDWTRSAVDHLNKSLGALIPPTEQKELDLFFFNALNPSSYGLVSNEILEDYDYKLVANITSDQAIVFDMFRNELDPENIDPDLFELEDMKGRCFSESTFRRKKVSYTKTLDVLFPGLEVDDPFFRQVREVGSFKVQLLFFKKGSPSRRDTEIYPYRPFQPGRRKSWLDEFGGIKIYRDNFAVRPYGELNGRAFDWLSLGQRVAVSPVAASRKGWKVSPQNLAGTVMISRAANARIYDQTNREGIIENEHFSAFRTVILRIIREFEDDRSHIHYNLNELYKRKHKSQSDKEEGKDAATRIVRNPKIATEEDAKRLARAYVAQQDEIRELKDEQSMLRALATLGTVLVSFSHEMGQLQNTMGSRSSSLANVLKDHISEDALVDVSGAFNPFTILKDWEEDDRRVKQWFSFALTTIRTGRRQRRKVSIRNHLQATKAVWSGFLQPRDVELIINFDDDKIDAYILAFEIDLDSIFNNLILNSVEAFLSPRHAGDRRINIEVSVREHSVRVVYRDNGPGIHPSILEPRQIFEFATSTKKDPDGKPSGTGLGMWILGAVVQGYGGNCRAFRHVDQQGFHLELILPVVGGTD